MKSTGQDPEPRDVDRAIANEREKIAKWVEADDESEGSGLGLWYAAQAIRNGDHWKPGN